MKSGHFVDAESLRAEVHRYQEQTPMPTGADVEIRLKGEAKFTYQSWKDFVKEMDKAIAGEFPPGEMERRL